MLQRRPDLFRSCEKAKGEEMKHSGSYRKQSGGGSSDRGKHPSKVKMEASSKAKTYGSQPTGKKTAYHGAV